MIAPRDRQRFGKEENSIAKTKTFGLEELLNHFELYYKTGQGSIQNGAAFRKG